MFQWNEKAGILWVPISPEVVALLVNLVFSLNLPLSPSDQLEHLELFAGDMSVTRGEMEAWVPQCWFPKSWFQKMFL